MRMFWDTLMPAPSWIKTETVTCLIRVYIISQSEANQLPTILTIVYVIYQAIIPNFKVSLTCYFSLFCIILYQYNS